MMHTHRKAFLIHGKLNGTFMFHSICHESEMFFCVCVMDHFSYLSCYFFSYPFSFFVSDQSETFSLPWEQLQVRLWMIVCRYKFQDHNWFIYSWEIRYTVRRYLISSWINHNSPNSQPNVPLFQKYWGMHCHCRILFIYT